MSISKHREYFIGKSISKLEHKLKKYGYEFIRRRSIHINSKALIIEILNTSKDRNISQIQISNKSKRHGHVRYVKISTIDYGIIKIINSDASEYITDGKEKAKLLFRRYK